MPRSAFDTSSLQGLSDSDGNGVRSLELDAPATVSCNGRSIEGRVLKLSTGFALFVGTLVTCMAAAS